MDSVAKKDGRRERHHKVLPYLSKIDRSREANLSKLVELASRSRGAMTDDDWSCDVWSITCPKLLNRPGRNTRSATIAFRHGEKTGGVPLNGSYGAVARALVVLRHQRSGQSLENQRTFITSIAYVQACSERGDLLALTTGDLDRACLKVLQDYSEGSAYNLHKAIGEFAALLDANGLTRIPLNYKYARMRRPANANSLSARRLDDPSIGTTDSEKMADESVYQLIGQLFQAVPHHHPQRIHVLTLTIIAVTGRRFCEVAWLPLNCIEFGKDGEVGLRYFPAKMSKGRQFTPSKIAWLSTDMAPLVVEACNELERITADARSVAGKMRACGGPVLDFLERVSDEGKIERADLESLGLPGSLLCINGWLRKRGLAESLSDKHVGGPDQWYTTKAGVVAYCWRDFHPRLVRPFLLESSGAKVFLDDLLLCRLKYLGGRIPIRAFWLAESYSHAMLDGFLRNSLRGLAEEFAPHLHRLVDFTSHAFRHTLNTLLDEGGLPELLQTSWFGRKNERDTAAYQHTSRERKLLEIRAALKDGRADGLISQRLKKIPVSIQDAYLEAKVRGVHDVGVGTCVHDFSQLPCERHLQCSARCEDLVWLKEDASRIEEQKRMWAMTRVALDTAIERSKGARPRKSDAWIEHAKKKLSVLEQQLSSNNVAAFDPYDYLNGGHP